MGASSPLELPGPASRNDSLDRLTSRGFDLLVVGGGITGAGIALDAATRGLSVALIDKHDFASGTSSKSSKLVHGGLRYLEHRDFGLMHEAASERDLLRRLAPHLVIPTAFFWPRWAGAGRKASMGLWVYDVLAAFRNVHRHRRVGAEEAAELLPGTNRKAGGYLFYDSQTDDTRLTLAVVEAARRAGAVVSNYLEVRDLLSVVGRTVGCVAHDSIGGQTIEIRAGDVVNATGVWADDICLLEDPSAGRRLRPSKGIHILLPHSLLPVKSACLIPTPDRKLIFVVPWRSSVIVGTTDSEYDGPLDAPAVAPEEIAYLLGALAKNFDRAFSHDDLAGAYAGLRPLLAGSRREATRDLSRRHAIFRGPQGLVTITGGKLTTYRSMAEEAVNIITRRQGRFVRCVTDSIRLGVTDLAAVTNAVEQLCAEMGLPPEVSGSLLFSYGDDAPRVLKLAREMDLASPVVPGLPYLEAELVWGVRREMAVSVEDLLARRLRLALEHRGGGIGDPARVVSILAGELGLTPEVVGEQISGYEAALGRERGPGLSPLKV